MMPLNIVIASAAKQSRVTKTKLDCFVALLLAMTVDSPPMQQPRLQQIDQLPHRKPEQRQDDDAGEQLIGLHQIAGLQDKSADAVFGADHFGAHYQQERDRSGDAEAG